MNNDIKLRVKKLKKLKANEIHLFSQEELDELSRLYCMNSNHSKFFFLLGLLATAIAMVSSAELMTSKELSNGIVLLITGVLSVFSFVRASTTSEKENELFIKCDTPDDSSLPYQLHAYSPLEEDCFEDAMEIINKHSAQLSKLKKMIDEKTRTLNYLDLQALKKYSSELED